VVALARVNSTVMRLLMSPEETRLARATIQALVDDWALVEDLENDGYLILVDESRNEMEDLRPRREFVAWLEQNGYVKNFGVPLDAEPIYGEWTRTYLDGRTEVHSSRDPHVFDFRPTTDGLALISADDIDV